MTQIQALQALKSIAELHQPLVRPLLLTDKVYNCLGHVSGPQPVVF